MKHFLLILSILVAVSLSAFNRPVTPADSLPAYYESIDGASGKELMDAIQLVAKIGYRTDDFRYDSVWLAFQHTDLRPDGYIWEIYSDCDFVYEKDRTSNTTQTGECKGYNREHAMCQSWFGTASLAGKEMSSSKKNSPGSDIFHIYPTAYGMNSRRGNRPYGEVAVAAYTSFNGTKYGTPKSISVPNTVAGAFVEASISMSTNVLEPIDEYKGDIARIYFYMLTCYMDKNFTQGGKGYRYFTYSNGVCNFNTTALALMLKWHREDPVSDKEITRNSKVEKLQGNVNPFVLQPALVEYIWGTMKGKPYDCDSEVLPPDPGTVDGAITCQEAREKALALSKGSQSTEEYVVVGYVTSLNGGYSTQYKSQSFWVADTQNGGNVFYAYQCYYNAPVVKGDKVSLTGRLLNYNGTPEMKWGQTNVLIPASATAVENVETLDLMDEQVEVYSLTGQHISTLREALPQGVYVLRHGDKVGKVVVR